MPNKFSLLLCMVAAIVLFSCGKDDPEPRFSFSTGNIDRVKFFPAGTLTLHYSTDGTNFTATVPSNLGKGATVKAKVFNGSNYVTSDLAFFDWSASSPKPANVAADVAEFSVASGNISVSVTVESKLKMLNGDITMSKYTNGGTPAFMYSIDGGTNYTSTAPTALRKNDVVLVKVNNGASDLTADDTRFNWSASTTAPADPSSSVASITIGEQNVTVGVTIMDKLVLVAGNRGTGVFNVYDKTDGTSSDGFSVTYEANTLTNIRSLVYNFNDSKLYAGTTQNGGGYLYAVNSTTKVAELINSNDDGTGSSKWDGIAGLTISPGNTIIGTAWYSSYSDQALVEFSLAGEEVVANRILDVNPCCGMGLVYNEAAGEYLVGDYSTSGNKAKIYRTAASGTVAETLEFDFDGFDVAPGTVYVRSLAFDEFGTLFGLLYDETAAVTYLVKVDLANKKIVEIAALGNQSIMGMAFIPAHKI